MNLSAKAIALITVLLSFLLFPQNGWSQRWANRSKQEASSRKWKYHRQWVGHDDWSNGDWNRWRRNNYYSTHGWGSPYYDYAWYRYQLPTYSNYWSSYPSTFASYTYSSYPYYGKWYTGNWASHETLHQTYHNTGYYSGSP